MKERWVIVFKGQKPDFGGVSAVSFATEAETKAAMHEIFDADRRSMGSNRAASWLEVVPVSVVRPGGVVIDGHRP